MGMIFLFSRLLAPAARFIAASLIVMMPASGESFNVSQFWHFRDALVLRVGWGMSATGEVWVISGILA